MFFKNKLELFLSRYLLRRIAVVIVDGFFLEHNPKHTRIKNQKLKNQVTLNDPKFDDRNRFEV